MNIVLVQHSEYCRKKYCFSVPDQFASCIKEGTRVICDTSMGQSSGTVVSEVLTGEAADRAIVEGHATMPLKSILAVVENVNIADVSIPIYMRFRRPRREKLIKRKQELFSLGCVTTKVYIDENGVLRDGYSAYLVCKNKGMSAIPVAIYAEAGDKSE